MGTYHGPNSDCYHCQGCGTHRACDDCDSCQSNMNAHRQLRSYESDFGRKVNELLPITLNTCVSIIENLKIFKGIFITHSKYDYNYLTQLEEIIGKMKEKKENIIREASYIYVDYSLEGKIKSLESEHERNMEKIKKEFNEKVKKMQDPKLDELHKVLEEKKKEKDKEKKIKDAIEYNQRTEIGNYKNQIVQRLDIEFNKKIQLINYNYRESENIKYPTMEYNLEEKEEKKYLLDSIRKIQQYKNVINNSFNYDIFIYNLKLTNYLSQN